MEKLKLEKFKKFEIKNSGKLRGGASEAKDPIFSEATCVQNCHDVTVMTGNECDRIVYDEDCRD